MIDNENDIKFGARFRDEKGVHLMTTTITKENPPVWRVCEFHPQTRQPIGNGRPLSAKRILELIKGQATQNASAAEKQPLSKKKDPRKKLRSPRYMATAHSWR